MAGDEPRVITAFSRYIEAHGWSPVPSGDCDLAAVRGHQKLFAEAKGRVSDFGTDLDILYGQLLRRMSDLDDCFAVVVPTEGSNAALRVPAAVREHLNIHVYEVTDNDTVRYLGSAGADPVMR